jgi:type II secretory pathway pseudopilin PulG
MKNIKGLILRTKKKADFTLIEILIVMTLLLVVGGVVTVNIRKAIVEQKYRTEVELVVDTLRLAQDLMLIAGLDLHLFMKQASNDQGIECWLEADGEIPKKWERMIAQSHRLLTAIRTASFKEQRSFPITEGMLDLRFQSLGSMMSRGILKLSFYQNESMQGPLIRTICLSGYPHPIVSKLETDSSIPCRENKEFDLRLTQQTEREILEDVNIEKARNKEKESN